QIQSAAAGRAGYDLLHVAVWSVQKPAAFRSSQNGDGVRGACCTQVRTFQRIDGYIDLGVSAPGGVHGAHTLADVEHRSFVPLTFADHNSSRDRNRFEGGTHRFNSSAVSRFRVTLTHGTGRSDGGYLRH